MNRLPDWRTRLHRYLAGCAKRPLAWGRWDCALHAADAVEVMTGVDLAADMRGRYTTAIGAQRALKRLGYADVVELAEAHLTASPRAREGDIVAVQVKDWLALAVMGRGIALGCRPDHGLWPIYDRPVKAFSVPF